MTNSTEPLERFVTAGRIDLKTRPQSLRFRQPMPAGRPSQDFVVPVFVSVVIHAFLACLLWVMVSGRTEVEPEFPTKDTPLIVSLSTYAAASHDEIDLEVVSEVPHTVIPAQSSQSSPDPSRRVEHKSEAEAVVTSIIKGISGSEAPEDKPLAPDAVPSFDLDTAYRMELDFEIMPEFKAEYLVTSIDQGVPDSKAPEGKSISDCLTPSFDLEAVCRMEREFGKIPESEYQYIMFKWRKRYIKNYLAETRALHPDCRTAYANKGLLAIFPFINDAITDNACKWLPEIKEIK